METIKFIAPEYQEDGSFEDASYEFAGSESDGWQIRRNGQMHLELGPGYVPVSSRYCGVCSTDLARKFLPYPLPQIIGHEVIGYRDNKPVVIEINASHLARHLKHETEACPFCSGGMNTQCPERITLGIDKLPGGFAPWVLAPVDAIIPVPEGVPDSVASLTEPLAAALQAVEATPPLAGETVAVLGPRRLGSLVIAALAGYRNRTGIDFKIAAVARHQHLLDLSQKLGADELVNNADMGPEDLKDKFDIVYDTTGNPAGFQVALNMARRTVSLKSTNGQEVMGLNHLTDMVVDEIALLPLTEANLKHNWPEETALRNNKNVYVAPSVTEERLQKFTQNNPEMKFHRLPIQEARGKIREALEKPETYPVGSPFPRFDLAIAASLGEVDQILRPVPEEEFSLVRPRGAILLAPPAGQPPETELAQCINEGGLGLHTSRCGDFHKALQLLADNPEIVAGLEASLITHYMPLAKISEAFGIAADSATSIKVLVDTAEAKA